MAALGSVQNIRKGRGEGAGGDLAMVELGGRLGFAGGVPRRGLKGRRKKGSCSLRGGRGGEKGARLLRASLGR
jgi:hypothetical protein